LTLIKASYDSYDYEDENSESDTDQGYGGSTGIFGLEELQNQESPEVDTGSGDYSSMFASVKEKYLKNNDEATISPRTPDEILFSDKDFFETTHLHGNLCIMYLYN
jgi:hypothetical protein